MKKYIPEFVQAGIMGTVMSFTLVNAAIGASMIPYINIGVGLVSLIIEGLILSYSNYEYNQTQVKQEIIKDVKSPFLSSVVTLISFILMGTIALLSFLLVSASLPPQYITYVAFGLTLLSLFVIGLIRAPFVGDNIFLGGFRLMVNGGLLTGLGYGVGYLANKFLII